MATEARRPTHRQRGAPKRKLGTPYWFPTPRWFEGILRLHSPDRAGDPSAGRLELCVPETRYDDAGRRLMGEQILPLADACHFAPSNAEASALDLDGLRVVGRNWKQGGSVDRVILLAQVS